MFQPLLVSLAVLLFCTSSAGNAAEGQTTGPARAKIDVSKLGPQVGQPVPDFSLPDQTGRLRTLESIMGPRGALLVFLRSADWWPYCRTQLVELQGRLEELRKNGIGVASISYDSQETLAGFAARNKITFPLLSDVGSATIRRYGIVNTVVEEALGPNGKDPAVLADLAMYVTANQIAERHRGIPFPGTFMIDRQGRVTSRFFEDYYWERNTVSNVMLRTGAAGTPVQATRASTQHLDVTVYPSDASVGPGTRFSLVLDIAPKPGMHVYAPGATQYRVITVNIPPQPYLRATPLRYAASEIYHFVPLDERVPVYRKPFTLSMDVVRENTPEARKAMTGMNELVINGTLEYQACDEKICYNPASLPLSWKIGLIPNVPGAPAAPQQR